MHIYITDDYAYDIIVNKLQEDYEDIGDDIAIIESMNNAGETNINVDKFYTVRDSIKNVLRYYMEEDLFHEWEDIVNEQNTKTTRS